MASIGTWPAAFEPISFKLEQVTNQRVNSSPGGMVGEAVDLLNERWMVYMTLPQATEEDAQQIEALVNNFRGQVNWISLWHMARPAPRGTISGSPTLQANVAQGAKVLPIQAVAGQTVLGGDLLGVGGLLLMAAPGTYTADGGGVLSVTITGYVRKALTLGDAVTINKPTAPFRLLSTSGVGYAGGEISEEVTFTFEEKI